MIALLATIVGIGLVIYVHELGHFLAARAAGVRVHVFSLGFGPRLFGWKRGDTDYRVSAIPLGGYVRMAGEEAFDRASAQPGDLLHASPGWRLLIFSGGILMNFLFAFLLLPILFTLGVPFETPVVGSVDPEGAAWEAGVQAGDRVLEVDGREVHGFRNIATAVALAERDEPVQLAVRPAEARASDGSAGAVERLTVDPRYDRQLGFQRLGLAPAMEPAVVPGSHAAQAGLRPTDEITALGGTPLRTPLDAGLLLGAAVLEREPLRVDYLRDGEARSVTLQPRAPETAPPPQLGVSMMAREVDVARGPLADALRPGDAVLAAGGEPVHAREDLLRAVVRAGGLPALEVLRAGERLRLDPRPDLDAAEVDAALRLRSAAETVVAVRPGSAADQAGLRTGDQILRVDNQPVRDFAELRTAVQQHVAALQEEASGRADGGGGSAGEGRALRITVLRGGAGDPETLEAVLRPIPVADYGIGLRVRQDQVRSENPIDALATGITEAKRMVLDVFVTLRSMVAGDIDHRNLGGIITIGRVTHTFATQGLAPLLFFLCLVSVNLGVLNLLPVPALDGGHILFVLLEKLRGRPVSLGVQAAFNVVGAVLVVLLLVFVTTLDINRLME